MKCSGLDVERYSVEKLAVTVGEGFKMLESFKETHRTPFDTEQRFTWAMFRKQR